MAELLNLSNKTQWPLPIIISAGIGTIFKVFCALDINADNKKTANNIIFIFVLLES